MSKEMSVILLGVAVILVTYSGFPASWRMFMLLVTGFALIVIGYLLRAREQARTGGKTSPYHPFVESDAVQVTSDPHESHKEGITSLN